MIMTKKMDKLQSIISAIFTILSLAAFVVILVTLLVMIPIEFIVTLSDRYGNDFIITGAIADEFKIKRILMAFAYLYGFKFFSGMIVSILYAIYIKRRFLGRPKSYLLEVITLIVAVQTVYTYNLLQSF